MAGLLVSVRSEAEARAAVDGGAAIIDVKEPSRGSLGMASFETWRRVRDVVPSSQVVSVALGELTEWIGPDPPECPSSIWSGIGYCKIGLAGVAPTWREEWTDVRRRLGREGGPHLPGWVGVVYLDWESANAPEPLRVIEEAEAPAACAGVLFDTRDKWRRVEFGRQCEGWLRRLQDSGCFVALAGSLDEAEIRRLRPLGPDLFAVRGAACRGGDRNAAIDPERVARLVEAARGP